MKIKLEGFEQIGKWANGLGKDLDTAALKALNRTAFEIRDAEYAGMRTHFDKPTPRTLRSLFIDFAKPNNLEAAVRTSDSFSGVPPARYLGPQVYGGARSMKSHEKQLGLMTAPINAPRDQYGNVKGSYYVKVLSQLGKSRDSTQNATDSKRSKKKRATQGFFIAGQAILSRKGKAEPTVQLLLLNRPLRYTPRLPFHDISKQTYDAVFERKLISEIRKARGY